MDVLPFLICFTHSTKLGASYPSVGFFCLVQGSIKGDIPLGMLLEILL